MATQVQERGISRSVAMTAGDSQAFIGAGSLFRVNCTIAGNVVVVLEDGTEETIPVTAGYFAFPYRVQRVKSTGTTATATYANLYASAD